MILGSVAYLGSLSRKSVVMTAGNLTLIVSIPPSTSLFTVSSLSVFSSLEANVACRQKTDLNKIKSTEKLLQVTVGHEEFIILLFNFLNQKFIEVPSSSSSSFIISFENIHFLNAKLGQTYSPYLVPSVTHS